MSCIRLVERVLIVHIHHVNEGKIVIPVYHIYEGKLLNAIIGVFEVDPDDSFLSVSFLSLVLFGALVGVVPVTVARVARDVQLVLLPLLHVREGLFL
jgi:Ni/Fe-hydrogenase subunit HybB-like protein